MKNERGDESDVRIHEYIILLKRDRMCDRAYLLRTMLSGQVCTQTVRHKLEKTTAVPIEIKCT